MTDYKGIRTFEELLKNLVSKEQINPNLAAIKVASLKTDSSVDSFIDRNNFV